MKTILVALDGSEKSSAVLWEAVRLARLTQSTLLLFRAFAIPPHVPDHVWALPEVSLMNVFKNDCQRYLDSCAHAVPPDVKTRTRVELGVPWQAIVLVAAEEHVDLVVIGSHGYGGFDHLLGTTAAKVVNHVDRPVLVFRNRGLASGNAHAAAS